MRLMFFGGVMGRAARQALIAALPNLRKDLSLDAVVVNVENAAGGFGVTPEICEDFFHAGADVLSTGNHIWDQPQIGPYLAKCPKVLRPHNYKPDRVGQGAVTVTLAKGEKLTVINLMGALFMPEVKDPFQACESLLQEHQLGVTTDTILVDFHAETSSEKAALAYYVDGRVSALLGTHTHVPTADQRILPKGTAFQTDVGMCGDYNSVIGIEAPLSLQRFLKVPNPDRMKPAMGPVTLCGALLEIEKGRAKKITSWRKGGILQPTEEKDGRSHL